MCLLAVLGSQGIVVKCTAAILFLMVDLMLFIFESPLYVYYYFSFKHSLLLNGQDKNGLQKS